MKKLLTLLALHFLFFGFCQKKVLDLPLKYQSEYYDNKESLAISNKQNGDLLLLVEDYNISYVYLYDSMFNLKFKLNYPSLEDTFKNFLGYNYLGNDNYQIIFSNNTHRKFAVLNCDFKLNKSDVEELTFKIPKERYLEGINLKDTFFVMTLSKKTSELNLYNFKNVHQPEKSIYDISYIDKVEGGVTTKAIKLLTAPDVITKGRRYLTKIDPLVPNSIEVAINPYKLYTNEQEIILTLDYHKDYTKAIVLNPFTKEFNTKRLWMPTLFGDSFVKHNSYYMDGKIFQLIVSNEEVKFSITNFKNEKLIKSYNFNRTDSISFKNTPIYQEKTFEDDKFNYVKQDAVIRELKKTQQFVRKLSNSSVAIVPYKVNDSLFQVTLGGLKEVSVTINNFGNLGDQHVFNNFPFFPVNYSDYNSMTQTYKLYFSTISVKIDCLFDNNFNHVKGEVMPSVFERINKLENTLKEEYIDDKTDDDMYTESEDLMIKDSVNGLLNIFEHKHKFYLGGLHKINKTYHIFEFEK